MSAAFVGGGGTWMLETVGRSTSSIWLPRWEVYDQNAANRRIWRVTYHSTSTRSLSFPQPDLGKSEARLVAALTDVKQFSERSGLNSFTLCFARAMETIQSRGTVQYSYHRDLAPAGVLSRQALYLLDACQSAWVFGGMGSWNEMCFEGSQEEEYARVSEELFEAVNACIEDATNSVIEPSLRET